ncbi:MAG: hypothetical protein JXA09_14830 [Anaerolineae bacterium]|nr:hypothetical protein [Anaerolineae bacterium]
MGPAYQIYWGDTHHNTYQQYVQDPPLDRVLQWASTYLDFYTGAYYTPAYVTAPYHGAPDETSGVLEGGHLSETLPAHGAWSGVRLEGLKEREALLREWDEFQQVTAAWDRPGAFVAFPGYEWQGNARWGDHNVIYRREGHPIYTPDTLPELYDRLRAMQAIAIPHHTGYYVGQRAPRWEACDDTLSPFAELYSIHGCSETDEEWIGLRHNSHMGPGTGGGTYQEALDRGLRLGAICSTDNWTNMPGHWGQGLMACLAAELTRDALWDAFLARRVYGVTGDRIQLDFTCNKAPMGSVLPHAATRRLRVAVRGSDAIDRIELLRNGRVISTHNHQGTWDAPSGENRSRYKIRIEAGWGPRPGEIPLPDHPWEGTLSVANGRMVGWEPCWVTRDQGVPRLEGGTARFRMISRQSYVTRPSQGATLFEFEAAPDAEIALQLNGLQARGKVHEFAAHSRLLWYRDECVDRVRAATGVEPADARRGDVYYQLACKAKVHRAIPEAGYTASLACDDDEPLPGGAHYRVRVEQRNGQRAWSSPIWIDARP